MVKATHSFPRTFLWGTATSSHQVEGGNTNNDWHAWEGEPGRIAHGHVSGAACDWWGGKWEDDLDRAAQTNQNAHRLSIEWSRVEPDPATWDESAIDFYRQVLQGAHARGLKPMVTLHHFTNPLWVMERGGWLGVDIVSLFERYVRKVVKSISDLADLWVTINEPNVYSYMAYLEGAFPPGEKSLSKMLAVMRNMILAHAAAYHAIHDLQPHARVGLAHLYRGFRPANQRNPLDRWIAKLRNQVFNETIPGALRDGRIRLLSRRERVPSAAGTQDFLGVNYYTQEHTAFDLRRPGEVFGRSFFPQGSDLSPTGWIANEPGGFWNALRWARSSGLPVYVTENGVEDSSDEMRPRYLAQHIRQLWRAVNFNWPVMGYFHWSLVDNFEWERGWTQRFGLWELDIKTQERRRRRSADFYAEICQASALSSEMVAEYAPEIFGEMFPG